MFQSFKSLKKKLYQQPHLIIKQLAWLKTKEEKSKEKGGKIQK